MKTSFYLVALLLAIIIGNSALAQKTSDLVTFSSVDSKAFISSFKIIKNDSKAFLKWTVCGQKLDGVYLIERSVDGKIFETIGRTDGIGVPVMTDILYCFTDDKTLEGKSYYRITYITFNDEIAMESNIIPFTGDKKQRLEFIETANK